jgi:hypothetical protein
LIPNAPNSTERHHAKAFNGIGQGFACKMLDQDREPVGTGEVEDRGRVVLTDGDEKAYIEDELANAVRRGHRRRDVRTGFGSQGQAATAKSLVLMQRPLSALEISRRGVPFHSQSKQPKRWL